MRDYALCYDNGKKYLFGGNKPEEAAKSCISCIQKLMGSRCIIVDYHTECVEDDCYNIILNYFIEPPSSVYTKKIPPILTKTLRMYDMGEEKSYSITI